MDKSFIRIYLRNTKYQFNYKYPLYWIINESEDNVNATFMAIYKINKLIL